MNVGLKVEHIILYFINIFQEAIMWIKLSLKGHEGKHDINVIENYYF